MNINPRTDFSPKRVALAGSCVTRNNFNSLFSDYKSKYSLVIEQYQTSLISLTADVIVVDPSFYNGFEGFELKAMRGEIDKKFKYSLSGTFPDLIVVDLYTDAMFGCLPYKDSYITHNRWRLNGKPAHDVLPIADVLTLWETRSAFVELFTSACIRFKKLVKEAAPNATIVLNSARAVKQWRTDDEFGVFDDSDNFNERWSLLDSIFIENVECSVIDMPPDIEADGNHRHGRSNVHYQEKYHAFFMHRLDAISQRT